MSVVNEVNFDEQIERIFVLLAQPFSPDEIQVRSQGGRQLSYITGRSVMNRLDDVVGPANWWEDYIPQEKSVICKLSIRLPDGTVITKMDAGGFAGMSDQGDDEKSGFSDAFKRAAVKFGIGRHLYGDGIPEFACNTLGLDNRDLRTRGGGGGGGYSSPAPSRPAPPQDRGPGRPPQGQGGGGGAKDISRVRTGKDLWGFVKEDKKLIAQVNDFGKQMAFPDRMVEWGEEEVAEYKRHWNGEA